MSRFAFPCFGTKPFTSMRPLGPLRSSRFSTSMPASPSRRLEEVGHSVAVIDQDPERVPPARPRVRRPPGDRARLRPADPARRRHRHRRRLRRGEQRRQLQHHQRPRGPGDLRRAARGRPHLRLQAGRGLRAHGHPERGHGAVDGEPAAPRAALGQGQRAVARADRQGAPHADHGHRGLGRPKLAELEAASGARAAWLVRFGEAQLPTAGTRPAGRRPARRRRDRRHRGPGARGHRAARPTGAGTDAGRDRRCRRRRPVHRRELLGQRPQRDADREGRPQGAHPLGARAPSGCRPTPAR